MKKVLPTCVVLYGIASLLVTGAVSEDPSSLAARYGIDAKQARAMAAQLELRKSNISYAVSDLEHALFTGNAAACERQLDKSAALSLNGVRLNTCKDVIDERPATKDAHQKLKLHNQFVEITENNQDARVSVDVTPGGRHDVVTLRQVADRWLVTSFTSAAVQISDKRNSSHQ